MNDYPILFQREFIICLLPLLGFSVYLLYAMYQL